MVAFIFFPLASLYSYHVMRMKRFARQRDVTEAYLYESGDQLLLRTADGVLHKLDILFNDSHRLAENKDKSLIFVIENGDREYFINSKEAEVLDYHIMDKIIRAICIDPRRTQSLYHRLVSR